MWSVEFLLRVERPRHTHTTWVEAVVPYGDVVAGDLLAEPTGHEAPTFLNGQSSQPEVGEELQHLGNRIRHEDGVVFARFDRFRVLRANSARGGPGNWEIDPTKPGQDRYNRFFRWFNRPR